MSIQPPVGKFFVFSCFIGLVAALDVYFQNTLSTNPNMGWLGATWVVFIAWALYFISGAKLSRMHKNFFALLGGIILAVATIKIGGALSELWKGGVLEAWAFPIVIFFDAVIIIMLELTDWFELAPAYFFGFAGYFGFFFGNFDGQTSDPYMAAVHHLILSVIGLILGWITASGRIKILLSMGVPIGNQQTVYDKES